VTVIIAWRTKESAQLVCVEVVVASGEALLCPLEARERKVGVEIHVKLIVAARVGTDGSVAVQILRDEGPMSRGFEASAQT